MTRIDAPLISTVIPVYKVENYLRQTIESAIHQDIGFEQNIELILINDGSPDGSGDICREYANRYPDNIVYIEQENIGVSATRNKGLNIARGKYIHFLDSDDIIEHTAYSQATKFLEQHSHKIDFVALHLELFDGRLGRHPLDYKFTGDRVIDVGKEPSALILHMGTCIIKRSAIKHDFDTSVKISEDMKFLTELLYEKKKYGVVTGTHYYYRKRSEGESAIDGSLKEPTFYTVTPKKVYQQILKDWTENGSIHPYVQHVVMYDLQWRLIQAKQTVLSDKEERDYKELLSALIKDIDSDIILSQRHAKAAYLYYALNIKYDNNIPKTVYEKFERLAGKEKPEVVIQFIRRNKEALELEGYIQDNASHDPIWAQIGEEKFDLARIDNIYAGQYFLGELVDERMPFLLTIPIDDVQDIRFYSVKSKAPLRILARRRSRLANVKYGYAVFGDKIFTHKITHISVRSYSILGHIVSEAQWSLRILAALKLRRSAQKLRDIMRSTLKGSISLRDKVYPFALPLVTFARNIVTVTYRMVYYITIPFFTRRSVWIVSDRTTAAGDSGEVLYDYIAHHKRNNIRLYFAISKHSKDYIRLKNGGVKVVDSDGFWYRLLFLHASKIISSHADDHVINPFSYRVEHLNDLYTFDYVFLQHGIIRNDLSSWLNRYNKDIKLFITSAKAEYESILQYKYYYTNKEVLLSGLPRYDLLKSEPKKKLILAPTWRHWLAVGLVKGGVRPYNTNFKESDYYQFYNALMNDSRLLKALRDNNMTAEFYLHPALEAQTRDFEENDIFSIKEFPYDYRTAFKEGSLLVSDYSSVIFDFVYLKKPIVYTQFDTDVFYKNQTIYTKGYMDDEKDGFGPVVKTLDAAVDSIIDIIESGCKMKPVYSKRVDEFFAWRDKNSSKRVYDAILALDD